MSAISGLLDPTHSQATFTPGVDQYKHFSINALGTLNFGPAVTAANENYFTVTYTASGLDVNGATVELYTTSFRLFVSDNPCSPDVTIDASVWPANKYQSTLSVIFGETQTLQLTGILNNECGYSIANPTLVNSGDSTMLGYFTPTYNGNPSFTYSDPSTSQMVIT